MKYDGYKDLKVFRFSYKLAMDIFEITKNIPKIRKEDMGVLAVRFTVPCIEPKNYPS